MQTKPLSSSSPASPPKFTAYSLDDTRDVAVALLDRLKEAADIDADPVEWTETILDFFANTAADGVLVDARPSRCASDLRGRPPVARHPVLSAISGKPRATRGEFLYDLSHTTYPPYEARMYWSAEYWKQAFEKPPELRLALESEWGKATNRSANLALVMEDASKLLHAYARVKVVVFSSRDPDAQGELLALASKVVAADRTKTMAGGSPVWLWADLPWNKERASGIWMPKACIGVAGANLESVVGP